MTLYIKKPIAIEAIEYRADGSNVREVLAFIAQAPYRHGPSPATGDPVFEIQTLSGWQPVKPGDYVIKGTHDFYPCDGEVFRDTYEPVIEA